MPLDVLRPPGGSTAAGRFPPIAVPAVPPPGRLFYWIAEPPRVVRSARNPAHPSDEARIHEKRTHRVKIVAHTSGLSGLTVTSKAPPYPPYAKDMPAYPNRRIFEQCLQCLQ